VQHYSVSVYVPYNVVGSHVDMYSCMCVHSRGAAATRANGARFASYNLPSLPYDVTALEPVREREHREILTSVCVRGWGGGSIFCSPLLT